MFSLLATYVSNPGLEQLGGLICSLSVAALILWAAWKNATVRIIVI